MILSTHKANREKQIPPEQLENAPVLKIQLRFLALPSLLCPLDLLSFSLFFLQEKTIPSFPWKGKGIIPIPDQTDFKKDL